jgi:hypothetical protein
MFIALHLPRPTPAALQALVLCGCLLVAALRFSAASGHVLIDDIPNGICIVLGPRTNVDMHEASAPGQILIEDIMNRICIAFRLRAEGGL